MNTKITQKPPSTEQTPHTGPWFVVNMTRRWKKGAITRARKPTVVFHALAEAAAEAARISRDFPGQHYAVFECIGSFQTTPTKEHPAREKLPCAEDAPVVA